MQKPIPTRNDPWVRWARILLVLFISGVLLTLVGCEGRPARPADATKEPATISPHSIEVYIDPASGCQYLAQYKGGITPRMDRDGKQVCK